MIESDLRRWPWFRMDSPVETLKRAINIIHIHVVGTYPYGDSSGRFADGVAEFTVVSEDDKVRRVGWRLTERG
jgi:hypothetical protein